MAATNVRGGQVKDGSIQRADVDISTAGQALIRKILEGTGISISSTGVDAGTGDATVAIDPSVDHQFAVQQTVRITDAAVGTPAAFRLGHNTSAAPAADMGVGFDFVLESSTTVDRACANFLAQWVDPTDSARKGKLTFRTIHNSVLSNALVLYNNGGFDLTGTKTNDSAPAGMVGEYVVQAKASGSAVAMSNGVNTNICQISLTAGDWDVSGALNFLTTGSATNRTATISTTSATIADDGYQTSNQIPTTTSLVLSSVLPSRRVSLASTTTVYLVGVATFSSGAASGYGFIAARRVR